MYNMQQHIRCYSPDSESGSGRAKNRTSGGSTPSDIPANPAGELGGAGGSDGSGSSVSGPATFNDDDLGAAGLGVANIGSIDPLLSSNDDLTTDIDDDLSLGDTGRSSDLGTADDLGTAGGFSTSAFGTSSLGTSGLGTSASGGATSGGGLLTGYGSAGSAIPGLTSGDAGPSAATSAPTGDMGTGLGIGSGTGLGSTSAIDTDPDLTTSAPSASTASKRGRGKTALITGASSGIGRELANLFAEDGYDVVLVARSEDSLRQIAQDYQRQFGIQATVISQDLADPQAPDQIYAETQRQGLAVDVLVNNAGVGKYGLFANDTDWRKEQELIQINSASLVHLTKLFLPDMVTRNEGRILLLGSVASVIPHPLMAVYGATKAFNYSFGEALRNELKDTNVNVTVLMPPATDTDFFHKAGADNTKVHEQAKSMSAAEVAKAGYDALMAGKDKVATGMMAKMQVASAHLMPDQMVTQYMRGMLEKRDPEQESTRKATTTAITVVAVILGGLWLLTRNRTAKVLNTASHMTVKGAKQVSQNGVSVDKMTKPASPVDSLVNSAKEMYEEVMA